MFEKRFNLNGTQWFVLTQLTESYLQQTAALLNSEWPRSLTARCISLEPFILNNSSPSSTHFKLPVSLILLLMSSDESSQSSQVVGHLSLVAIATTKSDHQNLIFLQSLVVDKSLRGKGLGKRMMSFSHEYLLAYREHLQQQQEQQTSVNDDEALVSVRNTSFERLYLTTKDKQSFYESLGYTRTEPIEFYQLKSNQSRCNEIAKHLFGSRRDTSQKTSNETNEENQQTWYQITLKP